MTGAQIPAGLGNGFSSLHYRVQTASGANPTSYSTSTGSNFPGVKVAGASSWPLTSN